MSGVHSYKDLEIWKRGMSLVENIYEITRNFPKEEQYGLSVQMRRSSISVPSNIAEGFTRKQTKEFKRFLNISLGSLAELETQIILSFRLKYITEEIIKELLNETGILGKMTNKFMMNMN